ncbi:class III bacteriocin [Eubacterium sp. MSJ-13]|uniref:helveticin J family class III bacteriocin n=1 Tax=Eubacterium sp. MSJ-13 TaxID=2841513 RepID=UPI001C127FE3|nr:helveticin J family class III bacteriocin [Eubacterium sp. MSJ-13]MBU5478903.1 class III bacteriocin [Eubacterium sp. MSJ-13]
MCKRKKNYNANGDEFWEADKIGKIKYQPDVTLTSTKIDKLDDTEYSNKTRTQFKNLRRCAAYVSPDGKKMLMFKQSSQGNVQYSFYDFNAIKKALDSNSTNDRSFKYSSSLAAACDSDVINASVLYQ